MIIAWSATKEIGPRATSRPLSRMLCINWRKGKSCLINHKRFGRKMSSATRAPSQTHLLLRRRRCEVRRRPTAIPSAKKIMVYLFSSPRPTSPPNQSQYLASPAFIARATHHAAPSQKAAQTRSSSASDERPGRWERRTRQRLPVLEQNDYLPARAKFPVNQTKAAPASAGSKPGRNEVPRTCRDSQAIRAISGG